MDTRYDILELNALRLEALREEAERERLAQATQRKPGFLRQTLDTLFGTKAE